MRNKSLELLTENIQITLKLYQKNFYPILERNIGNKQNVYSSPLQSDEVAVASILFAMSQNQTRPKQPVKRKLDFNTYQ